MKQVNLLLIYIIVFFSLGCKSEPNKDNFIGYDISHVQKQLSLQLESVKKGDTIKNPRTINASGETKYISYADWTSGFFPGTLWYMYDISKENKWRKAAIKQTENLEKAQYLTNHHDIGFIISSSYGNGYRLCNTPSYKRIIIQAAKSLITRYRPNVESIQSWNTDKGWQSTKGWQCPVIIDNMMNLDLLFTATKLSGDSTYYRIAVKHANTCMKNHFRADYSCYHVVDYDLKSGEVRKKQTAQGLNDESSWSRGQAWALYAFSFCYKETSDIRYLKQAEHIAEYILKNKNMPKDHIPYWDFSAEASTNTPRDASSAAIIASALYQLSEYSDNSEYYFSYADSIMKSLSGDKYMSAIGDNNFFVLKHSVGSIPHKQEIDVPINYADYYFLEAIKRRTTINK